MRPPGCPVKAIKIEDGSAMIVPDLCIACGTCYRVCPAKAKQARNDLTRAKHLVQSGKDVYGFAGTFLDYRV